MSSEIRTSDIPFGTDARQRWIANQLSEYVAITLTDILRLPPEEQRALPMHPPTEDVPAAVAPKPTSWWFTQQPQTGKSQSAQLDIPARFEHGYEMSGDPPGGTLHTESALSPTLLLPEIVPGRARHRARVERKSKAGNNLGLALGALSLVGGLATLYQQSPYFPEAWRQLSDYFNNF